MGGLGESCKIIFPRRVCSFSNSFQNFQTNKSIYDVDLISQSPNKRVAKHHHHLDQQPNDSSIVVFNSHVAESDSLFLLSYYKIDLHIYYEFL